MEVADLRHVYRAVTGTFRRKRLDVTALAGISFEVPRGALVGLLGPNGAGKTTTVRILTTLLVPTSGTARVLGEDVAVGHESLRRRIGFVFGGERGLYWRISGLDNLRYFGALYGLGRHETDRRIDYVLDLVRLRDRADEKVQGYSRGMKQRLHLARALLHDPEVLFLDEPTETLDPVSAREIRGLIRELADGGKTILMTTHYMFEADELCDEVMIIDRGSIVRRGTPRELKTEVMELTVLEVETFGASDAQIESLRAQEGVSSVQVEQVGPRQVVRIQSAAGAALVPVVTSLLGDVGTGAISVREATLEDAYVRLVGGEN